MLLAATRAAACVVGWLVAAVSGAVIGAVVGFLTGFICEDGPMKGTLIGAITGGLASLELAENLLRIWSLDDCPTDTRIRSTTLLLRNLATGRVPRGSVFSTIARALDSEMEALREHQPHYSSQGNLFEPSSTVLVPQRAAVTSLQATTVTTETAAAGQTTCPICLDELKAGERARWLPECYHVFHVACIDRWLLWNFQCPMCRHAVY